MKYLYERGVSNQRHYNNTLDMKTQEDRTDVMFLNAVSVAHRWLRVLKFGSEIIFKNNKRMKRSFVQKIPNSLGTEEFFCV